MYKMNADNAVDTTPFQSLVLEKIESENEKEGGKVILFIQKGKFSLAC